MIPVTIIAGYLGAGKTTLINALLAGNHGRRLAVLVNDFGAVNIDQDMILRHDGDTIALSNGCVCCSIRDALGTALDAVIALCPQPDNIVIEASGVANPEKIAYYGQGWPGLRLDAIVTLSDSTSIRERAGDKFVGKLVLNQVAAADFVLLTKTDLIDDATRRSVRLWLENFAGAPFIVEANHGELPAETLLDTGGRDLLVQSSEGTEDHGHDFDSFLFESRRPFKRDHLVRALDGWPDGVLRAKGFVHLADDPDHIYSLQRVGRRRALETAGRWPDTPDTRLVMIGPRGQLDVDALYQSLLRCLVPGRNAGAHY
ncbi:MAG: GTP-binding protein [Alphaproteobacteria bacterium]|nr:GTP-binding protein [Alphaproteobacteria bacterium]